MANPGDTRSFARMDAYNVMILLSGLVIFSYLFDLFARRTRLPSVLLLLGLGIALRALVNYWGVAVPQLDVLLPTLGNVGLILIVFEGALELEYERRKRPMIRKAAVSALFLLLLTTAAIGILFHYWLGMGWHMAIANAVPLSVISSAVAIPSVGGLGPESREFVVYESSLSDILGIILFNFVVSNTEFGAKAVGVLSAEILGVLALGATFSLALLWLLGRIKHKVKFFLILAILVLVYALGKQFHLSTLVVVLAFGFFLANVDQIPLRWLRERFLYPAFHDDLHQFHSLSRESAFLIRTFFFVLFGFTVVMGEVLNAEVALIGVALLLITYLLRGLFLGGMVRMALVPLMYITPRGLISILLYFSLPVQLRSPQVGIGLLFLVVLSTCVIMAVGLLATGHSVEESIPDAQGNGTVQEP